MKDIKISKIARIIFTLVLLVLVYSKIDILDLFEKLRKVGMLEFLFCCFLYFVGQMLSAIKWKTLLNELDVHPSYPDLLKSFFLGMFINSFGLGTVGGDVARVFSLNPEAGKRTRIFASVIADRLQGLIVLLSIGIISLLLFYPPYVTPFVLYLAIAAALILGLAWFFGPIAISKMLPQWVPKRDKIIESLQVFPTSKAVILKVSIISFVFHMLQMYLAFFIFKMILQDLKFSTILSSIPFVNVASTLPLSVNGIGVRETVSVYLLGPAGISNEISVAFAAVWVLVTTVVSGICGLLIISGMGEGVGKLLNKQEDKI